MAKVVIGENIPDEVKAVERCQEGDASAFNLLVIKYENRLYNTLFRMTGDRELAGDLAQEAFIKAYKAIASFRTGSSFYTWIYKIAINTVYSHRRKAMGKSKINPVSISENPTGQDPASDGKDDPVEVLKRKELERKIQDSINALDDELKKVVVLRDIEGMEYEMISDILEVPLGTVKSRLHRGRMELRVKLKEFV